ncbi:hypothetical protein [Achromobacter phage Motura]|uniref:Uncharacterized protein n=1 Tax=Achromobacter phage Motura TaxID=2591403 RepID=A0A514CSH0_9CAUD|nr:peptidase [Achromobacter phage Motura]QDH83424.1 hypothetical protein [Achromobacter phage Motura]
MQIKTSDYVLVKQANGKPFLLKAEKVTSETVTGVVVKNCHIPGKKQVLDVPRSDCFANMGDEPEPGKAYGVDLEVYRGRKDHHEFGIQNFFYKPKKDVTKQYLKMLDVASKKLKAAGFGKMLNDEIIWELYKHKGQKWAGFYYPRKGDTIPPRIKLYLEINGGVAKDYIGYVYHEFGHHLHSAYLMENTKMDARWIQLFNTSVKVVNINKSLCEQLLQALLDGETRPSKFKGDIEDDELKLAYQWVLRTIQQNHAISVRELDRLFEADFKSDIEALWPKHHIRKKDLEPIVSDYATTNYRELFAESFRMYMEGIKLPKNVHSLLEKTLTYIKNL